MRAYVTVIIIIFWAFNAMAYASPSRYGETYCDDPDFHCHRVKAGETWDNLFPDQKQQDIVMRVNRMNISLRKGMKIAIPHNLANISLFDVAPFPLSIDAPGQKVIVVDLNKLAWGAYDPDGNLVLWGPASGGRDWCEDIESACRSVTGTYKIEWKEGYNCTSTQFPFPDGGAAMPFCMHYYEGYALHGSFEVPGYNASHGCIRMFINDARWLNEEFSDRETKVVVEPY